MSFKNVMGSMDRGPIIDRKTENLGIERVCGLGPIRIRIQGASKCITTSQRFTTSHEISHI